MVNEESEEVDDGTSRSAGERIRIGLTATGRFAAAAAAADADDDVDETLIPFPALAFSFSAAAATFDAEVETTTGWSPCCCDNDGGVPGDDRGDDLSGTTTPVDAFVPALRLALAPAVVGGDLTAEAVSAF